MPSAIAIPENRIADLNELYKSKFKGMELQRFLCVWLRITKALSANEIAYALGLHADTVRRTQRDFIIKGVSALMSKKCGGRYRQLMSEAEEKVFLATFEERAVKGIIVVAGEIKVALEQKVGHPVHTATVYRILQRNKWRKVVPRPKHPKQDIAAQEAFKKGASKIK